MKRLVFITTLILALCFAAFSQNETNSLKQESKLLAEFNDTDNEWNKLSVSMLILELGKNPSAIGWLRIRNDKNFKHRLKSLRTAMLFMKADLSRINLLVTDIDKIEKLFRPKINKSRKN